MVTLDDYEFYLAERQFYERIEQERIEMEYQEECASEYWEAIERECDDNDVFWWRI